MFIAPNPPMGAVISYWIRDYTGDEVKIRITAANGGSQDHVLRELSGTGRPGINRVVWDLQPEEKQRLGNPHGLPEFVAPGEYEVSITYGERSEKTTVTVLPGP